VTKNLYLREDPVINFGYPFTQNHRSTFFRMITACFSLLLNIKELTSTMPLAYELIDPKTDKFKVTVLKKGGG
jgi:hypothetical protein